MSRTILLFLALAALLLNSDTAQARYRGGMNLYAYVGGMPTKYVDPSGLSQFPAIATITSNTIPKPFPLQPATGSGFRLFSKALLCSAQDAKNIEVNDSSYIKFSVDWDYTLANPLGGSDNTHTLGRYTDGRPGLSVDPFEGCDGCSYMRIQISHKGMVKALKKGHKLYRSAVSSYAPNAGAMGFGELVRHEWDHARTFHEGLFEEYKKLAPLMEKRFDTKKEWNRVAQCIHEKVYKLYQEAQNHSALFDSKEHYLEHYENFPFQPTTTFDECLK